MRSTTNTLMLLALVGCAKGGASTPGDSGGGTIDADTADATCGNQCDHDHDGVVDGTDKCPNTAMGDKVNSVGCADSQLTATLQDFPPFGLMWTPTGDLGKAGGLTWTYININRADLFHIYWIVCDDPATPCGISLDGPIDVAAEHWTFSASGSDLPNGKLVFTNTTHILLADNTNPPLNGRLTLTITDATGMLAFTDVASLHVTPRAGAYGAEITHNNFTVVALAEVQDPTSMQWTPYIDYYNAQPTPTTGGGVTTSFGGSFYAK